MKARGGPLLAGVLVAVALAASACGGPATPGVSSLTSNSANGSSPSATSANSTTSGSATTTGGIAAATKQNLGTEFAKCMRKHGVKNFPEHGAVHLGAMGGVLLTPGSGLDPNSPTYQAAQQACQSLLPMPSAAQVQKIKENALKFSKCMRKHGVTNFPDPKVTASGGGIGIRVSIGAPGSGGFDPNSPTFKAALQAWRGIIEKTGPGGGPHGG